MSSEEALDFSMKKSPLKKETLIEDRNTESPDGSEGCSQSPSSTTPAVAGNFAPFNIFSAAAAAQSAAAPANFSALLGVRNSAAAFQPFSKKTLCPTPPFFGVGGPNHVVAALGDPFSPPGAPWMPSALATALATPSSVASPGLLQSIPDPAFFPTASLALSTIHRRRRGGSASATSAATSPGSSFEGSIGGGKIGSPKRSLFDESDAKRPPKGVPDDQKDDQYWDRRRKNNEAAKRSRDNRRAKEEEIAMRATLLEQENLKLRAQVAVLKNETAKLHFMLFSQVQQSPGGAAGGTSGNSSQSRHILA